MRSPLRPLQNTFPNKYENGFNHTNFGSQQSRMHLSSKCAYPDSSPTATQYYTHGYTTISSSKSRKDRRYSLQIQPAADSKSRKDRRFSVQIERAPGPAGLTSKRDAVTVWNEQQIFEAFRLQDERGRTKGEAGYFKSASTPTTLSTTEFLVKPPWSSQRPRFH